MFCFRAKGSHQRLEEVQAAGGGTETGAEERDGETDKEAVDDVPLRSGPEKRQRGGEEAAGQN